MSDLNVPRGYFDEVPAKWVSSCTLADYPHNCPKDGTGHFAPPAADAGPRQMREHTSDCCLDLDHKGDCKRWMKLPPNFAYPHFKELHVQDDWCLKAGCRPASQCEIDAYSGTPSAAPVPQEAAPLTPYGEALLQRIEDYRSGYSCGYSDGKNGTRMRDKDAAQLFFGKEAGGIPDIFLDDPASAPDEAMRVAREIRLMLSDKAGPISLMNGKFDDAMAALIRQAGSERERELTQTLRELIARSRKFRNGWFGAAVFEEYLAEAARLLGGEAK